MSRLHHRRTIRRRASRSNRMAQAASAGLATAAHRYQCDPLEKRVLLSTITWTNRGLASDNFTSTFGVNAAAARNVVDAVIAAYTRVITSFNYFNVFPLLHNDNYNMTLSMNSGGTGFGAGA